MKFITGINHFLAASIGWLNAITALFLVVVSTAVAIGLFGGLGILIGPLVGAALAVILCGALAVLINIRDLLAAAAQRAESDSMS